jgi:hypothetical protein
VLAVEDDEVEPLEGKELRQTRIGVTGEAAEDCVSGAQAGFRLVDRHGSTLGGGHHDDRVS